MTYKAVGGDGKASVVSTVLTQLGGKDAPVMFNGTPTGQTMAIRRIDDRHTVTILKFQGKQYGTSKAEISPDGKVLKVENEVTVAVPGQKVGKKISYWDKQH